MITKIYIHGDMDGVSAELALLMSRPIILHKDDFEIVSNPNDLAATLKKFIDAINNKEVKDYFHDFKVKIIIADLDLKEEALNIILENQMNSRFVFEVYDHHPTSVDTLKSHPEYNDWLHATVEQCGCMIVYNHFNVLEPDSDEHGDIVFRNLIELVDQYDRGIWTNPNSTDLNLLFKILGPAAFIENVQFKMRNSKSDYFEFFGFEKILIQQRKNEIEAMVNNTLENGIYEKKILGFKVAITTLSNCDVSIICSKILEHRPEYDFIINLDLKFMTAQLRTKKEEINLTDIAQRYGGGGHKKASGFPLHKYDISNMIDDILGITNSKQEEWFK
jgi:oligoribonuclease NrnB/cAMP/cGMP phosphodiesterase (DHH superfamily)